MTTPEVAADEAREGAEDDELVKSLLLLEEEEEDVDWTPVPGMKEGVLVLRAMDERREGRGRGRGRERGGWRGWGVEESGERGKPSQRRLFPAITENLTLTHNWREATFSLLFTIE